MIPIKLLGKHAFDVRAMQHALELHPKLWDQNTERTAPDDSPHHGLSDIWARFADPETMREDGSHDSVWLPPANVLPVREMVFPLMNMVRGERLGGVLITRIPPGKQCRWHVDPGWHARYYQKYAIQIAAGGDQAFHFKEVSLVTEPGDLFWFDNSRPHSVTNDSAVDRITMIVCIKTEGN